MIFDALSFLERLVGLLTKALISTAQREADRSVAFTNAAMKAQAAAENAHQRGIRAITMAERLQGITK